MNKNLRIIFTGSIYIKEHSPLILLDAIANLIAKKKIPENSIVIDFYGARLEYIQELSKISKYSKLINILNHVPRSKAIEIQRNADLLLLLSSSKEISRGVLSGKIFEYIAAGRPILCIGGRADFEISKVLKLTKTGILIENHETEKLENIIYETFCGEGMFKSYKPDINEILKFSRKNISKFFLSKIEGLVFNNKNHLKLTSINVKKKKKRYQLLHIS